jgi:hypothetical protein
LSPPRLSTLLIAALPSRHSNRSRSHGRISGGSERKGVKRCAHLLTPFITQVFQCFLRLDVNARPDSVSQQPPSRPRLVSINPRCFRSAMGRLKDSELAWRPSAASATSSVESRLSESIAAFCASASRMLNWRSLSGRASPSVRLVVCTGGWTGCGTAGTGTGLVQDQVGVFAIPPLGVS